jgi:hypothetical protein
MPARVRATVVGPTGGVGPNAGVGPTVVVSPSVVVGPIDRPGVSQGVACL